MDHDRLRLRGRSHLLPLHRVRHAAHAGRKAQGKNPDPHVRGSQIRIRAEITSLDPATVRGRAPEYRAQKQG